MARTTTGNDVFLADVCFKVFHNCDYAAVLSVCSEPQPEECRNSPEEQPLREKLLKNTPGKASCLQSQLGMALSLSCHPQPPVPASPAVSLQQRNIVAFADCLIGTKTDFQLHFLLSKINKLQCFKSEAFIRPCIPQVASVLSLKSCV